MEVLTRARIIKTLCQSAELSAPQASGFLESTLEIIISSLINDGHVKIFGFGSFNVRKKTRRIGRNPKTMKDFVAKTKISDAMSEDMGKRGFKFRGSTICYAFMQAVGMVDDHMNNCWKKKKE